MAQLMPLPLTLSCLSKIQIGFTFLVLAETTEVCDARCTVTFPSAGRHRPLTGTKLYVLVIEAHVHEQLAQGCYLKAERPGTELATFGVASPSL